MTRTKRWQPRETRELKVGDFVWPDGWHMGDVLVESEGFSDESFPGCQFRLQGQYCSYAVNVKMTGRVPNRDGAFRCKVEFVGDGEPSTFSGAWVSMFDG